jgi:hypothetical protein
MAIGYGWPLDGRYHDLRIDSKSIGCNSTRCFVFFSSGLFTQLKKSQIQQPRVQFAVTSFGDRPDTEGAAGSC